jgi:hypothetical protein
MRSGGGLVQEGGHSKSGLFDKFRARCARHCRLHLAPDPVALRPPAHGFSGGLLANLALGTGPAGAGAGHLAPALPRRPLWAHPPGCLPLRPLLQVSTEVSRVRMVGAGENPRLRGEIGLSAHPRTGFRGAGVLIQAELPGAGADNYLGALRAPGGRVGSSRGACSWWARRMATRFTSPLHIGPPKELARMERTTKVLGLQGTTDG